MDACHGSTRSGSKSEPRSEFNLVKPHLPPCRVCGARASGFHFGAITCESCKVFFRRAITRQEEYVCKRNQKCVLTPGGKRVGCSYCRLTKCKDLGMSKDGVRRGRYSLERRTDCILESQGLLPNPPPSSPPANLVKVEDDLAQSDMFLEDLVKKVTEIQQSHMFQTPEFLASLSGREAEHKERKKLEESLFGPLEPLSGDTYQELYQKTGLDLDNRRQAINNHFSQTNVEHILYVSFAKKLPGFVDIPIQDQMSLLRVNRFIWWVLSFVPNINTDDGLITCSSCGLTFDREILCKIFGPGVILEVFRITQRLQRLGLSQEEMGLLKAITILSTDNISEELRSRDIIEAQQMELVESLVYHINRTHSKEDNRLANILNILTESRNAQDEYDKLKAIWFDIWPDLNYSPLGLELIDY